MLQTDRKATETTRQSRRERESAEQRQSRDARAEAALALEAILAGGSWEQLPAEAVLSLSRTVGNAALADMIALRETGPETDTFSLPDTALTTVPLAFGGGAPLLAEAPVFGALPDAGGMAPLEMNESAGGG